jgi:FMN-dependent NADH-azoreductase
MTRVLYIEASPRGQRSHSTEAAQTFLAQYRLANPQDTITTLNLWQAELPAFDASMLDAKYRILHGEPHNDKEAAAWKRIGEIASEFKSHDKFVISVPMWNFSIPYVLKQYIDIITQPGITFGFTPETGYFGLVKNKPALTIYARGGTYHHGSGIEALDYQKPYTDFWLRFIGFDRISNLIVEPTLSSAADVAKVKERVLAEAKDLAAHF